MRLPRSLQGRLLVLVLGLVVGVWMATAVMTWFDVRHELDELLDSHLAQAAALLVVQQARELEDDDRGIDAPTLHRYAPKVAFQVFHEGRLALRSANAPAWPMVESGQRLRTGFKTVQIDAVAWRVFAAHGGERDVQVFVGEQVNSRAAILWAVLRSTLWPMAVALPLLALAAWWAVYRGVAPLRRLGRTLAERQPRSLHPVSVDGAPSEMAPMLAALNGLFERIAELMESERRFTADAAHELRTPIAGIRAQAQVALGEADDAGRRHALQSTLAGCDRATRLVEQLLTLSRLEAGAAPATALVELSALVRRVVAELAPQAIHKQQTIELDAAEPCQVAGDDALLAVLVRNLVDNAIRYSPPNAALKVAVARRRDHVLLKVEDSGPGMAEPDLQRLGERFFRVIGSGQGGSGLGWSIVRRIAAAHQAAVHVGRSTVLGGLAVEVEWPVQPAPRAARTP
jgi:two-component system sensor histidine kinase QseC